MTEEGFDVYFNLEGGEENGKYTGSSLTVILAR